MLRNQVCKEINIMFPTNGSLINETILEYLLSKNNVLFGISIDGPMVEHDRLRQTALGEPTYEKIISNLQLIKNRKRVGLAVTITNMNLNVDEIFNHLYNLGVADAISMKFVRDYEINGYGISSTDLEQLFENYKNLADLLIENVKLGNIEYLYTILRGADIFGGYLKAMFQSNIRNLYRCDAGRNRIAVNNDGKIYACSVFLGDDSFLIGDIFSGINADLQRKFALPTCNSNEQCTYCWAQFLCAGECYATAFKRNNDIYEPDPIMCSIRKYLLQLSIYVIETIKDHNADLFSKIKRFVLNTSTYFKTDEGVWALARLCKYQDIKTADFSKIQNTVTISEFGSSPTDLLKASKKLGVMLNAYKFNSVQSIKDANLPAIIFLNKINSPYYRYALLYKEDESYKFENLSGIYNIPVEKVYEVSDILIF